MERGSGAVQNATPALREESYFGSRSTIHLLIRETSWSRSSRWFLTLFLFRILGYKQHKHIVFWEEHRGTSVPAIGLKAQQLWPTDAVLRPPEHSLSQEASQCVLSSLLSKQTKKNRILFVLWMTQVQISRDNINKVSCLICSFNGDGPSTHGV